MKKNNNENLVEYKDKVSAVNVHDDAQMVKLGIRPPKLEPRDPTVWTKTSTERNALRRYRRKNYGDMRFHTILHKSTPVVAKLIIYLKKNDMFPKTTYSQECYLHNIGRVLALYTRVGKKSRKVHSLVSKYVYNGQTYKPEERPYWFGS